MPSVWVCAIAGGLMLAASLGLSLLRAIGVADEVFVQHANGVSLGIVLAVIGNTVPKIVTPLRSQRCTPAQLQSDQRFAGWAFTLAGIAYALAWMFVASPLADTISTIACASAVATVLGRLVWRLARS